MITQTTFNGLHELEAGRLENGDYYIKIWSNQTGTPDIKVKRTYEGYQSYYHDLIYYKQIYNL